MIQINPVVFQKLDVTINTPLLPLVEKKTVILTLPLLLDDVDNDIKLIIPLSLSDEIPTFIVINRPGPYLQSLSISS